MEKLRERFMYYAGLLAAMKGSGMLAPVEDDTLAEDLSHISHLLDAEEDGLLLRKEDAVDEGHLQDWYIHSVSGAEPVWTEAHIEELFNDFILIPKAEAEKALAEMGE